MNNTNELLPPVPTPAIDYLTEIPVIPEEENYDISRVQIGHWLMYHYGQTKLSFLSWIQERIPFFKKEIAFEALKTVISRHDILRTTFIEVDGLPRQVIHPFEYVESAIQFYKVERPYDEVWAELKEEAIQGSFNPFDGPLFYVKVVETLDDVLFFFNMDHSITDDLSNAVLKEEIFSVYRAYLQNEPNPLSPLRVQYRDFVYWHKKLLVHKTAEQFQQYWHRYNDQILPKVTLSSLFGESAIDETYQGQMSRQIRQFLKPMPKEHEALMYGNLAKLEFSKTGGYEFIIGNKIYQGLKKRALENGTSMFNVLTFGFHLMVYRLTQCNDSILGVNVPMRNNEDLINMVGFLLNTILIRNQIVPSETFNQNLNRIATDNLDTSELAFYPVEHLLKDFDLPFTKVSNIFINMINNEEGAKHRIRNFASKHVDRKRDVCYFDLDFHIGEQKNGIEVFCEYVKSIFSPTQVEEIHRALEEVLSMIAFQADTPVEEAFAQDPK